MKAYFFNEYRDKAGIGSVKKFDTKEEAIAYCMKEWEHFNTNDKEAYLHDPCGRFYVYQAEALTDEVDGEEYAGECEAVVYDALEEYRKQEADKIVDEWGEEISFSAAVALMDDDIREAAHADLAPCTPQEFYDEYCKRHMEKYGEEFTI